MMELKKTIQLTGKLKDQHFAEDGHLYDGEDHPLNLEALLYNAFLSEPFTISVSTKSEDSYLVEEDGGYTE